MKLHDVIFDASSIWTQKPQDKLHCAISCLYFDRGLFEVLSRHITIFKIFNWGSRCYECPLTRWTALRGLLIS